MYSFEILAVILFVSLVLGTFVAGLFSFSKIVFRKTLRMWDRAFLGLSLIGLVCVAWGTFVEPYWLEVTQVTIPLDKLRGGSGSRALRIVHLSDFHSEAPERLESKAVEAVERLSPRADLIFFTGDALNSDDGIKIFRESMARLSKLAPTYGVLGNWDVWYFSKAEAFENTGVTVLKGSAPEIRVAGTPIRIAGWPVDGGGDIDRVLSGLPAASVNIFLHHYPAAILISSKYNVDVQLSGHTHGGQVRLPFWGALITLSQTGKLYEAGLYKVKSTWLYVNRGLGMEGGRVPRVRFLTRPEVTVIDLIGGASSITR